LERGNNAGQTTQGGTHYSGYWAPQSVSETIMDQKRKRLGIQATMQTRPFDNLEISANYFRFQLNGDYTRSTIKIPEWGFGNFFTGATFDKSGTIMTGATFQVPAEGTGCRVTGNICTMETPAPQDTYVREKSVSNTYDVRGNWELGHLNVDFVFGKTKATGGPSFQFYAQAKPRNGTVNGNALSTVEFHRSVDRDGFLAQRDREHAERRGPDRSWLDRLGLHQQLDLPALRAGGRHPEVRRVVHRLDPGRREVARRP
jgi:iron complex outermembrane receptor protein